MSSHKRSRSKAQHRDECRRRKRREAKLDENAPKKEPRYRRT